MVSSNEGSLPSNISPSLTGPNGGSWPPDVLKAVARGAAGGSNNSSGMDDNTKRWMKRYRTEISALSASLCSTLCAYPLDSVKTRMQAYKFSNFRGCVTHTYLNEGPRGFWRGVLAPLMSITLVRTLSFSIYQRAKYTYDGWIKTATGSSPLAIANTNGAWPTLSTAACFGAAGATSGALATAISCPFELTKLGSQIAVLMEKGVDGEGARKTGVSSQKISGTLGTARFIMKHHGVLGLYSGFQLHIVRDTIGTGIYFMTYESSKQILANAQGNSPASPLAVVVAGGLCGLVSWLCIYPIDSAKSIFQRNVLTADGTNGAQHIKPVQIEFFKRRMYRGLGVSMFRSCMINAIFFSVFELMKKQINKLETDDDE